MADCFTVSQINDFVKQLIDSSMGFIYVEGEIAQVSVSTRGHTYITLQEGKSILKAVSWAGNNLSCVPEKGMSVNCFGKLTAYQSGYQLILEKIALAGLGNLEAIFLKRKEALTKEGLFDAIHKKALPLVPETIGVITSPNGAVIHDILACIRSRMGVKVVVWPVEVQGDLALGQVCAAIRGFNQSPNPPQVLIIARGGGSIEDLWPFNEEQLVREVFNSHIPVVSAIGHETDVTLVDYVADYRAPTPSLAAERVVPKASDLLATLRNFADHYRHCWEKFLMLCQNRLAGINLPSVRYQIGLEEARLDKSGMRLDFLYRRILDSRSSELELQKRLFAMMGSGYTIGYDSNRKPLAGRYDQLEIGDQISSLSLASGLLLRLKVEGKQRL